MANILDYLNLRGNLPMDRFSFQEVDNLILARLSYLPMDEEISSEWTRPVALKEAAEKFLSSDKVGRVRMEEDLTLVKAMQAGNRFADMLLSGFVNRFDKQEQKQFCAVTATLGDAHYIAFRGTDNTLVGWKEDFNMSFMTSVPSQREAVAYLNRAAKSLEGKLTVVGHSKGGNLAVYASAFCEREVQERIQKVYNNDGPGFDRSIIRQPGFTRIRDRIQTFLPQSSVVGMLLEHEEPYTIIRSSQVGLMQHDLYSWEVQRDHLVELERVTAASRFIDYTIKAWVANMTREQREKLVDVIYGLLEQTKARTVKELTTNWFKNALIIVRSARNLDEETREMLLKTVVQLFKCARESANLALTKGAADWEREFLIGESQTEKKA